MKYAKNGGCSNITEPLLGLWLKSERRKKNPGKTIEGRMIPTRTRPWLIILPTIILPGLPLAVWATRPAGARGAGGPPVLKPHARTLSVPIRVIRGWHGRWGGAPREPKAGAADEGGAGVGSSRQRARAAANVCEAVRSSSWESCKYRCSIELWPVLFRRMWRRRHMVGEQTRGQGTRTMGEAPPPAPCAEWCVWRKSEQH